MADVNRGDRPLSPHLSVYKPQITSISSILIRITGNALIVTTLLLVWWFVALASGPAAFERANGLLTSWFGDLVLVLSLLGLWYHTLGGARHLLWDTGRGLEIKTAEALGWACVIGSVVLTAATIILFAIL